MDDKSLVGMLVLSFAILWGMWAWVATKSISPEMYGLYRMERVTTEDYE